MVHTHTHAYILLHYIMLWHWRVVTHAHAVYTLYTVRTTNVYIYMNVYTYENAKIKPRRTRLINRRARAVLGDIGTTTPIDGRWRYFHRWLKASALTSIVRQPRRRPSARGATVLKIYNRVRSVFGVAHAYRSFVTTAVVLPILPSTAWPPASMSCVHNNNIAAETDVRKKNSAWRHEREKKLQKKTRCGDIHARARASRT